MRRLLLLFPLLSLCSTACESDGRELFTQLSVRFILPDDRPVERVELLSDISYCENINTKERVFFTVLDGRSATLTLQKGVYTLIVEANLHYTDGTVQYVRNADHNTPSEALAWMDDRSSIVLLLKYVN